MAQYTSAFTNTAKFSDIENIVCLENIGIYFYKTASDS